MSQPSDRPTSLISAPVAVIVGSILISFSILLSSGIIRIKGINPATSQVGGSALGAPTGQAPAITPPADTDPVNVSLSDAPVLGNKDAKLVMVEFSDYECPFCKKYFDEAYKQLKADYIDKGKMKLVFRNLPLSFHQNAHKEAQAALCAREQGGDASYFKYHDIMFTKTTSNGTGLALTQLPELATEIGLNGDQLKSCLDSNKYAAKVDADLADAATYGADGTPSFFIGKQNDDNTITGTKLVGAQPYEAFKSLIDQELAKN